MEFLLNYITKMSTITKKQTALALVAVVFATAMVASIAASADQMAFARHHHHYSGGDGGNHITVASSPTPKCKCTKQQAEHHQLQLLEIMLKPVPIPTLVEYFQLILLNKK